MSRRPPLLNSSQVLGRRPPGDVEHPPGRAPPPRRLARRPAQLQHAVSTSSTSPPPSPVAARLRAVPGRRARAASSGPPPAAARAAPRRPPGPGLRQADLVEGAPMPAPGAGRPPLGCLLRPVGGLEQPEPPHGPRPPAGRLTAVPRRAPSGPPSPPRPCRAAGRPPDAPDRSVVRLSTRTVAGGSSLPRFPRGITAAPCASRHGGKVEAGP